MEKEKKMYFDYKKLAGDLAPFLALIIMCIALTILKPGKFLTFKNLVNVIRQASPNAIISLGMMLAILTAGIDLSVGSIVAISQIVMAKLVVDYHLNPFLGILVCLLVGALSGLANGLLLTKVKLPHPFIATLGTQNIFRGLCLIITAAAPISGLPAAVNFLGAAFILNAIPVSLILVAVCYIMFNIFLGRTKLGRHIYAIGGNITTARLSGINVEKTLIYTYALSGLMCGLAGLVVAGRTDAATPLTGLAWETDAIAAVIIGGASFFGGKGKVLGTLSGVLLIAVLRNGLNLMNIPSEYQTVVLGAVIILSVALDIFRSGGYNKIKKIKPNTEKLGGSL